MIILGNLKNESNASSYTLVRTLKQYLSRVADISLDIEQRGNDVWTIKAKTYSEVITSNRDNMVPLPEGSVRAKALKRNYLISHKPTKVQWDRFIYALDNMHKWGVTFDLEYDGVTFYRGGTKVRDLPELKRYTQELKQGV